MMLQYKHDVEKIERKLRSMQADDRDDVDYASSSDEEPQDAES